VFRRAFHLCIALRRRIIRESSGWRNVNRIALRAVSNSKCAAETACPWSHAARGRFCNKQRFSRVSVRELSGDEY
jgi:hypothetical protein